MTSTIHSTLVEAYKSIEDIVLDETCWLCLGHTTKWIGGYLKDARAGLLKTIGRINVWLKPILRLCLRPQCSDGCFFELDEYAVGP